KGLQSIDLKHRAAQVAYLAQGAPAHWPISVHRLVELGRLPHLGPWARLQKGDRRAVERAMALADVGHLASRRMNTLSTGEQVRVLVARLLAVEPKLILADEPIAALDPLHQLQIMNVLKTHCARGGTAVVVLHDLTLAARFCAELALLHQGQSVLQGRPEFVLTAQTLVDVYGVEAKFASIEDQLYVVPWAPTSAPNSTA
ncbi:MAG: ABC transporter ATP-binding protein, partial [Gammaproteobacteria bacterium]|nr:ABC transporter ATP-binding protein [Gammaproteobacteria bacterium]